MECQENNQKIFMYINCMRLLFDNDYSILRTSLAFNLFVDIKKEKQWTIVKVKVVEIRMSV